MALLEYTSYAEVRAVLGVSATELPDSVLSQDSWGYFLNIALEDINSNIPASYSAVSALLSGSRSSQQQRFYELCRLFASYTTAKTLLTSLPMFSVQRLTDGRAEFQRQNDIYEDVRDGVDATLNALRQRLSAAFLVLFPLETGYTQASFDFAVSTGLGVDPVTNA